MILKKIEILWYRWFKSNWIIEFAIPNGIEWSWLTVIVWPNNSWKSSIIEAIKAREKGAPSFSIGKRNPNIDEVNIKYHINDGVETLKSVIRSSSETTKSEYTSWNKAFILPSRRSFPHNFGKNLTSRDWYIANYASDINRNQSLPSFPSRLFEIQKNIENKGKFDILLWQALWYIPNWTIDQLDDGNYFIKFGLEWNHYHSSEWVWEWIVSIFSIVDALYDSNDWELIIIDEPELSLHPQLQKRLNQIFYEYSATRQIIIATHSPYLINFSSLFNKGKLVRVVNSSNETRVYSLSESVCESLDRLSSDLNNPHVLWLDAKEIFFQEDNIILVEWQEDVIFFPRIYEKLDKEQKWHFFWWGMWWADKVEIICTIFKDLGYQKVFVIFDKDKQQIIQEKSLETKFPDYKFSSIPADDIRYKAPSTKPEKMWLWRDSSILEEYKVDTGRLLDAVNSYFS